MAVDEAIALALAVLESESENGALIFTSGPALKPTLYGATSDQNTSTSKSPVDGSGSP
jgi:hypothetical protein